MVAYEGPATSLASQRRLVALPDFGATSRSGPGAERPLVGPPGERLGQPDHAGQVRNRSRWEAWGALREALTCLNAPQVSGPDDRSRLDALTASTVRSDLGLVTCS